MYNIKKVQRYYSKLFYYCSSQNNKVNSVLLQVRNEDHKCRTYSKCLTLFPSMNALYDTQSTTAQNLNRLRTEAYSSTRSIRSFSQKSSSNNNDDDSKNSDDNATHGEDYVVHQALPATVVVPDVWPHVPLIAVNRNPLFPRFIKLIDVSKYKLSRTYILHFQRHPSHCTRHGCIG